MQSTCSKVNQSVSRLSLLQHALLVQSVNYPLLIQAQLLFYIELRLRLPGSSGPFFEHGGRCFSYNYKGLTFSRLQICKQVFRERSKVVLPYTQFIVECRVWQLSQDRLVNSQQFKIDLLQTSEGTLELAFKNISIKLSLLYKKIEILLDSLAFYYPFPRSSPVVVLHECIFKLNSKPHNQASFQLQSPLASSVSSLVSVVFENAEQIQESQCQSQVTSMPSSLSQRKACLDLLSHQMIQTLRQRKTRLMLFSLIKSLRDEEQLDKVINFISISFNQIYHIPAVSQLILTCLQNIPLQRLQTVIQQILDNVSELVSNQNFHPIILLLMRRNQVDEERVGQRLQCRVIELMCDEVSGKFIVEMYRSFKGKWKSLYELQIKRNLQYLNRMSIGKKNLQQCRAHCSLLNNYINMI